MVNGLKYKHWFEVRNNRIVYDDVTMYRSNVYNMNGKRGYLVFYEESEDKPISKESRAYYFKVLVGELYHHHIFYAFSQIEIHHELMRLFEGRYEFIDGEWQEFIPSMASENSKEWREYVEKVEYFVESLGIQIKPLNVYKIR